MQTALEYLQEVEMQEANEALRGSMANLLRIAAAMKKEKWTASYEFRKHEAAACVKSIMEKLLEL